MEEKQFNETDLTEVGEVEEQPEEHPEEHLDERPEEPAEQQREELAAELPEEPAEEQPEELAEEQPEEPAEEQPEELAEKQLEEPAAEHPEELAEKQPEEPAAEQPEELAEKQPEVLAAEQPEEPAEKQPEDLAEEQPEEPAAEQPEEHPAEHPMNALMEDALSLRRLKRGDIVDGMIVSVTPTEVLVDVGAKSEGVIPSKELERLGREGLESLQIGESVPVYVVKAEDREGNLVLSLRRAEEESDWRQAQTLYESSEGFETQVAGFNKGGLIVRLGRLRGFVPASQLSPEHQGSSKLQPEERWARLVGATIFVKVIELNRKRKRLILSERAALRQYRDAQKEKLLDALRVGEVREGTVSSLSDFGAFVDLGGADGLIHLSELSWNRSDKPSDVLRVGQKVEVYILNVDQERKRIGLSLKRLEPEPWATVESRYYVGQLVEGTITRLANFGAFALVNDEIEGLIHISELSSGRINHPAEVVHEGEKHVMRIIRIDPRRRRMGLSLKRVADPAYADLDWRAELAEAESSYEESESEDDQEAKPSTEDDDQDL
jgi:small subunit ribosomal protein S1